MQEIFWRKEINLEDLKAPFSPASIHWRVGATNVNRNTGEIMWGDKPQGIALAYIDARDVMARLDHVCGMDNWQDEYPFQGCCRIGIRVPRRDTKSEWEWVWKSNGAGVTDVEADKGQYSDAFKRAAVLWGVGQYLYDLPNQWFPIEKKGKSFVFGKDTQKSLQKFLNDWQKVLVPKEIRMDVAKQTRDYLSKGDEHGIKEVWAEFNQEEQVSLWPEFDSAERSAIKKMLGAAA